MANPGPNSTVTSNLTQAQVPGSDGREIGINSSALIGFWGATPIVQPTAAAQATVVDSSGGTANAATGVAAITGTYNQVILANALATILAQTNAIRSALVSAGLMKGS